MLVGQLVGGTIDAVSAMPKPTLSSSPMAVPPLLSRPPCYGHAAWAELLPIHPFPCQYTEVGILAAR